MARSFPRRELLRSALGTAMLVALPWNARRASAAAFVPPQVLVFATGQTLGAGINVKNDSAEATRAERVHRAAVAMVDLLNESNAVQALLYHPESTTMKRAILEAKIQVARPEEPTAAERFAIAKAAASVYTIAISAEIPRNGEGIDLTVHGDDLLSGKSYLDQASFSTVSGTGSGSSVREAIRPIAGATASDNALMSAVNTLVVRMLAGPLNDYARTAPPRELLPPSTPRTPADQGKPESPDKAAETLALPIEPDATPEALARAAREQAESLLRDGDTNAAINLLRKSVNNAPFDSQLRLLLTRAYLSARRGNEAASEAQRALTLTAGGDRAAQAELTRMLAEAFALTGDRTAARSAYEQIITSQPEAQWAKIALANLLLSQDKKQDAETLLRDVRKSDPSNPDAALGLARLLADRDDYAGAQQELAATGGTGSRTAFETMTAFFDERAGRLGRTLGENRAAWQNGTLSREALYNATNAQNKRVTGLIGLLKAVPPPAEGVTAAAAKAYQRRIYAGSLLAQAVGELLTFLETGDADAGAQSMLQLSEFQKEMNQIRLADPR